MNIHPDDPKWTAYVLGELDAADRAEVERELESSADAREIVDDIRMMTSLLKDELAKEAPVTLHPEQRRAVVNAVAGTSSRWPRWLVAGFGVALAAMLVLTVAVPSMLRSRQSAISTPDAAFTPTPTPARQASQVSPAETPRPTADRPPATAQFEQAARNEPESKDKAQAQSQAVRVDELAPLSDMKKEEDASASNRSNEAKDMNLPLNGRTPTPGLYGVQGQGQGQGQEAQRGVMGGVLPFQAREQVAAPPPPPPPPPASTPAARERLDEESKAMGVGSGAGGGGGRGGRGGGLSGVRAMPAPSRPATPAMVPLDRVRPPFNTEAYDHVEDNPFKMAADNPLATFSIDVDTAAYANVRRFLTQNQLPPKDAVRIEELINYFNYDYAQPTGQHPIAVHTEVASAPWKSDHRLVRIGIKAKDIDISRRPPSNLVFLIDVSGSMQPADRLPLLKSSLKLLVDKLGENDRVAIAVYAGTSGLVLPPTSGTRKEVILQAIDRLEAGGSTNGASGIQLAYNTAVSGFIRGGVNRVILCTDGDFNVGVTSQGELTRLIEDKARSGVFLSVLGFGTGNLKDSTMEQLADKGNGNYAYIDSLNEGRKVLVEEMGGTLMTIAKDVKIQVDFNPAQVSAYRLIGYENRVLRNEDFNNDAKDAGDMGAGHTVTALFEIVPNGSEIPLPTVDASKYKKAAPASQNATLNDSGEMLTVRVRYKQPDADVSARFDVALTDGCGRKRRPAQNCADFDSASPDFRFAAAVAEFGMILRDSPHRGSGSLDHAISVAERSKGTDRNGYREEFVRLARKARALKDLQQ